MRLYLPVIALLVTVFVLGVPGRNVIAAEELDAETKKQLKKEIRATRKEIRKVMKLAKSKSQQAVRGSLVYKTYCVLCHGEKGDGTGRMMVIHKDLPLAISKQSFEYYETIVLEGGPAVGRSQFMPAWKDELTGEQVNDLVMYLKMFADPVSRGEIVFKTRCILCHGVKGDGLGRASVLYDPPPSDLTKSDKNDAYKKMIITMGGEAMGRSPVMPVWGQELSESQIDDVVKYLRSILKVPDSD